jgi:hypothetical protein
MAMDTGLDAAHEVGINAYIYLYPLVTMELTRQQMTNVEPGQRPPSAPMNMLTHIREFPAADFRIVVRPNFDTLYSSAWLDLTAGPVVVSAGADPDDRYYELPLYDMWTDVFAVPGQRTTGTRAGNWALTPPGWQGDLPAGVDRIDAPTPYVWLIGRTQTNGPEDYPAVYKIQDSFGLAPLAHWDGAASVPTVTIDPDVDMETPPLEQAHAMPAEDFFGFGLHLMQHHQPHLTDWSLTAQMRRLGLVLGARFADLEPSMREILQDVPTMALRQMQQAFPPAGPGGQRLAAEH